MDIWGETKIDFLRLRFIAFGVSILLVLIGLVAIVSIPIGRANLGTDFAGGVAVQFSFEKPVAIDQVRDLLSSAGFKDANLQQFAEPTRLLVKLKSEAKDLGAVSKGIAGVLSSGFPDNPFVIESTTEVGPTVGKKLQKDALWAVGLSMLAILVYIAWRFEWKFGIAAVIATFHDVIAVMGLLYLLDVEITLLIISAVLTLAGYSLTDTVVVFDRIRENLKKGTSEGLTPLINRSINEVLRRTIVTSLTTLLAVVALLLFGGDVIHDFSLALFMGILIGTYSSIFIASPLLLFGKGVGKPAHAKA